MIALPAGGGRLLGATLAESPRCSSSPRWSTSRRQHGVGVGSQLSLGAAAATAVSFALAFRHCLRVARLRAA
jgi:hypothetical protein